MSIEFDVWAILRGALVARRKVRITFGLASVARRGNISLFAHDVGQVAGLVVSFLLRQSVRVASAWSFVLLFVLLFPISELLLCGFDFGLGT